MSKILEASTSQYPNKVLCIWARPRLCASVLRNPIFIPQIFATGKEQIQLYLMTTPDKPI